MELSGINIQKYSTHSTRSAASSKAKSMGMSLKNIINKQGGSLRKHSFSITTRKLGKSLIFVFGRTCKYCNEHIGLKIYC